MLLLLLLRESCNAALDRDPFEHDGDGLLLGAQVVDADLRVRDTAAVPRLRVRLVLAVPVALRRAAPAKRSPHGLVKRQLFWG